VIECLLDSPGIILNSEGEKIVDELSHIAASKTASVYDKNVAIQQMCDAYKNPSLLSTDF
jgi:hypothetical protein